MNVCYTELLYQKASAEMEAYKDELRKMSADVIIEHSYETTMKTDILAVLENQDLDQLDAKALCRLEYPLDACFQEWLHNDLHYMDLLQDTVDDRARSEVRRMKAELWRDR